ncbi:sensor histidine kinase [Caenimonas soli]|uniref:sensor histidine kinase n=1 Tax=Caenimonas soli TaxID=2735555 RepID=UPI001553EC14|nr:PAS domain-containing sensor histidine kinase [Caenimonas soli]NPC58690.1 PAS domain S-box protein [Caenimonas soli]
MASADQQIPAAAPVSEQQFEAAFEFAPIGMALLDTQSAALRVNHALCQMLGYQQAELVGITAPEIGHPDDLAEDFALRAKMLAGAFPSYQRDKRYLHRDGHVIWTHISCSLVHDTQGRPAHLLLQVQDITQRKAAEDALCESEERFRVTFEQAALGIVHVALDGRLLRVNSSLCRMHGYSREELLGFNAGDLMADNWQQGQSDLQTLLDGSAISYTAKRRFIRKSGEVYPARVSVTLARSETSEPYLISIIEDLTEYERDQERIRKQAQMLKESNEILEQRIHQRTRQLEQSNQELRTFAYSIAHDLRAPLATTDGFSRQLELSLGDRLSEKERHYLNRMRHGVRLMSDLTDALLSLANLSQEPLQSERVDLSAIARDWLARARERHPERQAVVAIADTPPVQGDERLLKVLLENLLDNAWKFTSNREEASIEFGAVPGAAGEPVFLVRDNGAGFDSAYADKLFTPFQRLHAAHEFAGTGIGLAIVRKIAQRHGGWVWGESQPGAGAVFRFTLDGA